MGEHPHVTTVNRMTEALLGGEERALQEIFTDDVLFHYRGPFPEPGDHTGAGEVAKVIGAIVEATKGDIDLRQLFCVATDGWVSEWEHAVLGRNGRHLEFDNAFVYRFDRDRIAEMWMFIGAPPGSESFFTED
jgi:ketosteroid isomerase-like protein